MTVIMGIHLWILVFVRKDNFMDFMDNMNHINLMNLSLLLINEEERLNKKKRQNNDENDEDDDYYDDYGYEWDYWYNKKKRLNSLLFFLSYIISL